MTGIEDHVRLHFRGTTVLLCDIKTNRGMLMLDLYETTE